MPSVASLRRTMFVSLIVSFPRAALSYYLSHSRVLPYLTTCRTPACCRHRPPQVHGVRDVERSGNIFWMGIFLDFVRLTTRAPHGARARGAKRNRIDRRSRFILPLPFRYWRANTSSAASFRTREDEDYAKVSALAASMHSEYVGALLSPRRTVLPPFRPATLACWCPPVLPPHRPSCHPGVLAFWRSGVLAFWRSGWGPTPALWPAW